MMTLKSERVTIKKKPAKEQAAKGPASTLEIVPQNPVILARVREILKRRGFSQYQK